VSALLAASTLALFVAAQDAPPSRTVSRTVTLAPPGELAARRIADCDRDGRAELIVLARDGQVSIWRPDFAAGAALAITGPKLAAPTHALVDFAHFGERHFLVVVGPAGTRAYEVGADAAIAAEAPTWIARGRFTLRLDGPTFSKVVRDVNRDGVDDVVVPTIAGCELWLGSVPPDAAGAGAPSFRKAGTISVPIARSNSYSGVELSDSLSSSFAIPGLDMRDMNGDGRPDLVVTQAQRRAFHLQREDGSFPLEPDVALDLAIFRDTLEAAPLAFGGTLSSGDEADCEIRDLDLDGIPDFVISHRRKVWVFRGTAAGPQFREPSAQVKTAEDVTALALCELDDDGRPDLLLIKVQIPSFAALLRGLFGAWEVHVRAFGYRNSGGGAFERAPRWQNDLVIRLPGILELIKQPDKFLKQFEDVGKRFRRSARGDVDGDGALDTLLVAEDGKHLELWRGAGDERGDTREMGEQELRRILFGEGDNVWTIERVAGALSGFADRHRLSQTGGGAGERSLALRDPETDELVDLDCADFDGDGRDEILLTYRPKAGARAPYFDVVALGAVLEGDK